MCGFVGYFPHLLPIRLATLALLILTFFSLYRLLSYVRLTDVLGWFFWLAVAHSVYVLIPFVVSAGFLRSFGFSGVLFDDMALVALPIGVSLYLGARPRQATWYLLGSTAVLGGLIATQSRLSIVFGLFFAAVVVILAVRRTRREPVNQLAAVVRNRLGLLAIAGVLGLLALVVLGSDLLQATVARFERLQNPFQQYSTVAYRLQLWKRAIMAFLDHPVFGLGPGGFYQMNKVYTTLHLTRTGGICGCWAPTTCCFTTSRLPVWSAALDSWHWWLTSFVFRGVCGHAHTLVTGVFDWRSLGGRSRSRSRRSSRQTGCGGSLAS